MASAGQAGQGPLDVSLSNISTAELELLLDRHLTALAERLESKFHEATKFRHEDSVRSHAEEGTSKVWKIGSFGVREDRSDKGSKDGSHPATSPRDAGGYKAITDGHESSPRTVQVRTLSQEGVNEACGTLIEPQASLTAKSSPELLIRNKNFEQTVAIMIIINALTLGLEADYMARHWEDADTPGFFAYINSFMCFFFLFELILRILADGMGLWRGPELWWNVLSFSVTGVQFAEESLKFGSSFLGLPHHIGWRNVLRLLRTLRVIMIFPVLDHLHATDELNLLVTSIYGSLKSLACSIFVLFMFTFMFGVPVTHIVAQFKRSHPEDEEAIAELAEFYNSLDQTMMSLFQSISEGIHWRELMLPLTTHCSPWMSLGFILYVFISLFAMMNVVTGIFIDSAVRTAESDKKGRISKGMRQLFAQADTDGSGTISRDEFEENIKGNHQMIMYLRALEIDYEQATEMFDLLDADRSGTIDVDEFVYGCLRFQGSTKAIDFATFACEWRQKTGELSDTLRILKEQLQQKKK